MLNSGSKLGPYEIVGALGAGGMGEACSVLSSSPIWTGAPRLNLPWSRIQFLNWEHPKRNS